MRGFGSVLVVVARGCVGFSPVGYRWLALVLVLVGVGWPMAPQADAAVRGRLRFEVSGLPKGQRADAVVSGPLGLRRPVSRSRVYSVVPGAYVVAVRRVHLSRNRSGIPRGSLALPVRRLLRVRVRAGRLSVARVVYGTIRSSKLRDLDGALRLVAGSAASPRSIGVPYPGHPIAGAILTRAPSVALPHGLFARVTSVKRAGREAVLSLTPATLAQAFPELSVDATIALQPLVGPRTTARGAGLSPLDFSIGPPDFRCAVPLTGGYSFSTRASLGASAVVDLHFPLFRAPHGEVAVSLRGTAGLRFALPAGVHCDGLVSLPPLAGVVLGVPVYVQVGAVGSAQIAHEWHVQIDGSLSLTAGIRFNGRRVAPVFSAHGSASVSTTGAGKISVGPQLELGIGFADLDDVHHVHLANVHLDLSPQDTFTAGSDGCSLGIEDVLTAGVTFGPFQINEPATLASQSIYTCPYPAPGAAVLECGSSDQYVNLTARNVTCKTAREVRARVYGNLPEACYDNTAKPRCAFGVGKWRVRGKWFTDQYGAENLDLGAIYGRRVVRFQTTWDNA